MWGLSPTPQRSAVTFPIKKFACSAALVCFVNSAVQADESTVETVVVTASPLPGAAVDPDLVPTSTQTLTDDDISRTGAASLLRALDQSGSGVSLSNAQDNAFQPNLYYRGFQASPLAGDAQGLAVYVDGVRFNQFCFGDAVLWDLISRHRRSIDATVEGSNPVFGLNALGGSISLRMKDGFSWDGADLEAIGGSFDRYGLALQYGRQDGDFSRSMWPAMALHETGWRDHSPSRLSQIFTDFGWRRLAARRSTSISSARTIRNPDRQRHHAGGAACGGPCRRPHLARQSRKIPMASPICLGPGRRARHLSHAGQCLCRPSAPAHRQWRRQRCRTLRRRVRPDVSRRRHSHRYQRRSDPRFFWMAGPIPNSI